MEIAPLSQLMVYKIANKFIGGDGGYLGGFSYRTHREIYPEYCDLDIDPNEIQGTTRDRFLTILSRSEPRVQAKILRGVLKRFPLGQEYAPETRTNELREEILAEIQRLERASPVNSSAPAYTVEVVDRAISDAEALIKANGATSAVDRVHTALHGFILEICEAEGIALPSDASLSAAFKFLREQHPAFRASGHRSQDITQILKASGSILDAMNPLRNQASMAHPNENLLPNEEAMLVVNILRALYYTILIQSCRFPSKSRCAAGSEPRLPTVHPLAARAALPRLGWTGIGSVNRRPRRPNLRGQFEHPGPKLLGILDAMPRTVAQDDEAMRRANPQLFLDQQEVAAHLCPVPWPERPGGFPKN